MAVDKEKLKAFQEQHKEGGGEQDNPGRSEDQGQDEGEGEGDASEAAQDQRKLNPEVGYVELKKEVGALSCGNCVSLVPGAKEAEGVCINEMVRAAVSADRGHCKLWDPTSDVEIVFPPSGDGEQEEEEPEEEPEEEEGGGDDEGEDEEDDEE
jgi:hypothetical protein